MEKRIRKKIKENKEYLWKITRYIGGIILIAIGLSGIILPILPGWIFIIFGLTIILGKKEIKKYWEKIKKKIKKFKQKLF